MEVCTARREVMKEALIPFARNKVLLVHDSRPVSFLNLSLNGAYPSPQSYPCRRVFRVFGTRLAGEIASG